MKRYAASPFCLLATLALLLNACSGVGPDTVYFGKTEPPAGQVFRYITGSEPESLDPQISSGQAEARIYMALYEGLVEYEPKTMQPIPAVAESWESNADATSYTFRLRRDARFSDGSPITAHDFVYTFRRGMSPELASRSASFGYYVRYAKAYNEGGAFVRDPQTGSFLLERDVPAAAGAEHHAAASGGEPLRLTVEGDEKAREKALKANPKLKELLAGKEFVPVRAEELGVEALDDHTVRITLAQAAPYFVGMLAHPFFRFVPRRAVEEHGDQWTKPGRLVASGPFRLREWKPYDEIVVERNPAYWDAASVRLQEIRFYPSESTTLNMNLYKAGEVDAILNHSVPVSWIDMVRPLRDYMDEPEAAIEYYNINVTKPPMNDVRVRRAFNMAINKRALADWRRVVKPLTAFTPEGIFPGYPQPKGDDFDPERAKQLLAEAGYRDASGKYDPSKFPVAEVEIFYNAHESVRAAAEFIQQQWKHNLNITVPLRGMETKAWLKARNNLEYKGFSRGGWGADFLDPFAFLYLLYEEGGNNSTGWTDPQYVALLDEANRTPDEQKRYELLARAEAFMLAAQPVIPLYTPATNWVKKPYVKGLYPNPGTLHAWKYVYIEHDPTKWHDTVAENK
jgi:oligopeptide transport system substrate-binding protein